MACRIPASSPPLSGRACFGVSWRRSSPPRAGAPGAGRAGARTPAPSHENKAASVFCKTSSSFTRGRYTYGPESRLIRTPRPANIATLKVNDAGRFLDRLLSKRLPVPYTPQRSDDIYVPRGSTRPPLTGNPMTYTQG
jgi:hypothetical protein